MTQRAKGKKRTPRPPFLITVATLAGALAPACGGAVTTDGSGNTGGSAGSDPGTTTSSSSSTTGTTAVTTGTTGTTGTGAGGSTNSDCPATIPANGSSCATPGQTCSYPYCGAQMMQFTCAAGHWSQQSVGSCNPPPPIQPCPPVEPQAGTSCLGYTPQACSYANFCCGVQRGTRDYICSGSSWQRTQGDAGLAEGGSCGPCVASDPAYPEASTNPPGEASAHDASAVDASLPGND